MSRREAGALSGTSSCTSSNVPVAIGRGGGQSQPPVEHDAVSAVANHTPARALTVGTSQPKDERCFMARTPRLVERLLPTDSCGQDTGDPPSESPPPLR